MAGNNDLKILITGSLNSSATVNEINGALKNIEKKIETIKLNVEIDKNVSKTLSDFTKAMENHKKIASDLNKVVREEKVVTKEADGAIKEKIRQHLKSGEIIEKEIERINKKNNATNQEIEQTGKLISELDKLGKKQKEVQRFDGQGNLTGGSQTFKDGFTNTTVNYNKTGNLTGSTVIQNPAQQEQAVNRIRESLVKLFNQGKVNEAFFKNFNKVINGAKNVQEIEKVQKALERVQHATSNQDLQKKLISDAQTLMRTHKNTVDTEGMNKLVASMNQLNPASHNATNNLVNMQNQLKGFQNQAREAARSSMTFGDMLQQAFTKFPIWMLSATAFYAPIRALQDMTARLIEIDTLMTDLNRVMDVPDFKLTDMLNEAIGASDELSSKLTDMLSVMGDFARMGFAEGELLDISKTATVLQNISDLDATAAVDTLTSAMLNYNIAASESVTIADQLNEVD